MGNILRVYANVSVEAHLLVNLQVYFLTFRNVLSMNVLLLKADGLNHTSFIMVTYNWGLICYGNTYNNMT